MFVNFNLPRILTGADPIQCKQNWHISPENGLYQCLSFYRDSYLSHFTVFFTLLFTFKPSHQQHGFNVEGKRSKGQEWQVNQLNGSYMMVIPVNLYLSLPKFIKSFSDICLLLANSLCTLALCELECVYAFGTIGSGV